jgi:hypothetical protein
MTATVPPKPAATLTIGDHIWGEGVGWLRVVDVLNDEIEGDAYTEVDVAPGPGADIWDMNILAAATGAESASWLSGTNHTNLRYRLYYSADAEVKVKP